MSNNNDSPIIWYIPGFLSADDPQKDVHRLLRTTYPNAEDITNVIWENQNITLVSFILNTTSYLEPWGVALNTVDRWIRALADVESTSESLANKISWLSSKQRQKLILIGHSLGGNIVIRTLANLFRKKLSIRSAVLLGAAIDNRNENIKLALKATQKPICSMVNPNDAALKVFRTVTGSLALGTGCDLKYDHTKFREYRTSSSIEHSSVFYLSQWANINNIQTNTDETPIRLLENVANFLGLKNVKGNN